MCHLHVIYLYFLSQKRSQQTRRQCFSRRRASDYGAVSSVWCVCSAPCVLYAGVWRADTPSVCAPARSCAITSLAAPGRLIRPPLPWRRPIWQEAKWCWRDHCHLGPNEIQLRPNVRQDDSKRWATLQPARQPARKTQRHICAKKIKSTSVQPAHVHIPHMHMEKSMRRSFFLFCFILLSFIFLFAFASPLTPVVLYWLPAILRHKHRFIVFCLKSQSAPQICGCSRSLDRMQWQRGPIFHRVKVLHNH